MRKRQRTYSRALAFGGLCAHPHSRASCELSAGAGGCAVCARTRIFCLRILSRCSCASLCQCSVRRATHCITRCDAPTELASSKFGNIIVIRCLQHAHAKLLRLCRCAQYARRHSRSNVCPQFVVTLSPSMAVMQIGHSPGFAESIRGRGLTGWPASSGAITRGRACACLRNASSNCLAGPLLGRFKITQAATPRSEQAAPKPNRNTRTSSPTP